MTEDLSESIRLSVTIALLSSVVATTLVIFTISSSLYTDWMRKMSSSLDVKSTITFDAFNAATSITAAELYKLISVNFDYFTMCQINYLNGTVSANYNNLKSDGAKRFKVNIEYVSENRYRLLATEVNY